MNYYELEVVRERCRVGEVCQRAHLFHLAYQGIQAALHSRSFERWGINQDHSWPSYWHGIKALGTANLTFADDGGRMVVRLLK